MYILVFHNIHSALLPEHINPYEIFVRIHKSHVQ